jgi:putative ABC transport system permease protein
MRIRLAWMNLLHGKVRTLVAVAGVAFSVVLILMQLGFYGSAEKTATLIYDRLAFDVLLRSPQYQHLSRTGQFPKARLEQALSDEAVREAVPLYLGFNLWRNSETRSRRAMFIMAADLEDDVLNLESVRAQRHLLRLPFTVLTDTRSRSEFGPIGTGSATELGNHQVQVVGQFTLGTGFGADGALVTSDATLVRLQPGRSLEQINLGLVRLVQGADAALVAERLKRILPGDVAVLTRSQVVEGEQHHWVQRTSVGIIFGIGVAVALVVGIAIVYQVLSSDVASKLGEYATLKAIGYSRAYLSGVVLEQSVILGVLGFLPGLAVAQGLYALTRATTHLPIEMDPWRAVGVLMLSLVMCGVAGVAALRKVFSVDPADLF